MGWDCGGHPAYWTLTEHFETLNAIERYGDAYPWSVPRARERWTRWLLRDDRSREPLVVVALGRRAATGVGLRDDLPWGEWIEAGLLQATVAPHTSGRSRLWNETETRDLMRRILTEAIERAAA